MDFQSAVERLDLVPVKRKTGGEKMLTKWVTLATINCFGEKIFGFISNMSVTRIAKEKLLQKEIQDLSLSVTLKKKRQINTPPAEVTTFLLEHQQPTQ